MSSAEKMVDKGINISYYLRKRLSTSGTVGGISQAFG